MVVAVWPDAWLAKAVATNSSEGRRREDFMGWFGWQAGEEKSWRVGPGSGARGRDRRPEQPVGVGGGAGGKTRRGGEFSIV